MTTTQDPARDPLLDAILAHVAFDGWSDAAFRAAAEDSGMPLAEARAICPRGAVDLAVAFHKRGDAQLADALRREKLDDMRFRDKVARAVRLRLDIAGDKEAVRRGSALFALPHHGPEGARLIWGTADAIWNALGDPADDINWYTKRATLSGVYASTVLYWLGDDSVDHQATDAFIDRRIEDVMRIEKVKAQVNDNRLLKPLLGPLQKLGAMVKPPMRVPPSDLPGRWTPPDAK
ncbi:COQ9 family protein [Roseisalinus antarcticus]|uniref:COQ9 C-terminal domain-containing protein n=1 Tax=Roseisalinus antarcticus TaxID=254357 RepID=A0A1Y5RQS4_9RHOB|nr:COQ9 family protein [Roseisalinus antarcticus]SLN22264.1 hypothetical protein ROA7023_00628 [Roseisalinus antarcticus]